jgi:hypothetical protein
MTGTEHLSTDLNARIQRDSQGRLQHLITLEGMRHEELTGLLDLAQFYIRPPGDLPARDQSLAGHTVANRFSSPARAPAFRSSWRPSDWGRRSSTSTCNPLPA